MKRVRLLRGPGPFALPCELGVVLLVGRLGLSRYFSLYVALPTPARLEMGLHLPSDTLVVPFGATLLLPPLVVPVCISLLAVESPLVVWVDL